MIVSLLAIHQGIQYIASTAANQITVFVIVTSMTLLNKVSLKLV